nr:iron-siderophore ABC transporter substrate-binding protein [Paenibacillus piscarius]
MKGEHTLTEKPKVIAVLDVKFADQLIALGEKPAGSVVAGTKDEFPEYLSAQMEGVKVLGTRDEPNLEAIVSLNPDLILMTDFQEEAYESVSKIAPTIVLDFYEDWRDTLATIGTITGKQAEAEVVKKAYEDKIAGLREQLSAKLGDETVALIRPRPEGIRVHGPEHRTGSILYEDLGLKAPAFVQGIKDDTSVEISMETVADIGADHYFLLSDDLFAKEAEALASSAVWKSVEAVKNNRAYEVNSTLWIAYYGPLAINIIVDQAAEALLGAN